MIDNDSLTKGVRGVVQKALADEVWSARFGARLLKRLLKSDFSAMVEAIALGQDFWDEGARGAEKVKACFEQLHRPEAFPCKKSEEKRVEERFYQRGRSL
jgi:hypothetical protein